MRSKEPIRVLVIDHSSHYHEDLNDYASFLSGEVKYESRFTDSGSEAQKLLISWNPTVVLLGMEVTGLDSMAFLRCCHKNVTPVIVTSDERSYEIEESARESGAAGYVVKSDEPEHLEEVLQGIVRFSHVSEKIH